MCGVTWGAGLWYEPSYIILAYDWLANSLIGDCGEMQVPSWTLFWSQAITIVLLSGKCVLTFKAKLQLNDVCLIGLSVLLWLPTTWPQLMIDSSIGFFVIILEINKQRQILFWGSLNQNLSFHDLLLNVGWLVYYPIWKLI